MKHHHLSPSWKKWGRSSQTATNNKKNAPPLPRDRQLLVNFHQKGCDWSALERLTGNCLLEWHWHEVTSTPSITWASFPSRFLISPFEWVSLVSIQVFDWSVWMGQPCFHPGFWLVRLNERLSKMPRDSFKLPSTGYKPGDVCVDASPEKIDVIEHIERHHMAHSQRRDKSYFVSNDKGFIYHQLVQETMKRPDKSMPHRKLHKRGVRQKTFSDIVGVHGLSKDACYTVTVIYDTTNHKLITAFPTIWWKKAKRLERSEESWVHHWRRCFNDRGISIVTKKALHFILIVKSFYY